MGQRETCPWVCRDVGTRCAQMRPRAARLVPGTCRRDRCPQTPRDVLPWWGTTGDGAWGCDGCSGRGLWAMGCLHPVGAACHRGGLFPALGSLGLVTAASPPRWVPCPHFELLLPSHPLSRGCALPQGSALGKLRHGAALGRLCRPGVPCSLCPPWSWGQGRRDDVVAPPPPLPPRSRELLSPAPALPFIFPG